MKTIAQRTSNNLYTYGFDNQVLLEARAQKNSVFFESIVRSVITFCRKQSRYGTSVEGEFTSLK
jgi:hypothetical protein